MKDFFHKYGYSIVKMFLYQFAISLFGFSLYIAVSSMENMGNTPSIVASVFSTLFYLFLLYVLVWDIGAHDKISVDVGKQPYKPMNGFIFGLLANLPNFIVAIAVAIGTLLASIGAESSALIVKILSSSTALYRAVFEGMYLGIIMKTQIAAYWWVYFLLPIPSIITAGVAYLMGHKNLHLTPLVLPQDTKKKKK